MESIQYLPYWWYMALINNNNILSCMLVKKHLHFYIWNIYTIIWYFYWCMIFKILIVKLLFTMKILKGIMMVSVFIIIWFMLWWNPFENFEHEQNHLKVCSHKYQCIYMYLQSTCVSYCNRLGWKGVLVWSRYLQCVACAKTESPPHLCTLWYVCLCLFIYNHIYVITLSPGA